MSLGLHVKYVLFLQDCNETWIFSTDFRDILKYQNSWKSFQCEVIVSMRRDMTKPVVAFSNSAKAPDKFTACLLMQMLFNWKLLDTF